MMRHTFKLRVKKVFTKKRSQWQNNNNDCALFQYKYTCGTSGLEITTSGVYSVCGPNWCPYAVALYGKQELNIVSPPGSSDIKFVLVKVSPFLM